jgi:anion-transporting  ArsA/GET3 family ATPase
MSLPRVILITGKGGTGKSTTAAALALALSHRGQTVLADLDQRLTAARLLGLETNGADSFPAIPNLEVRSFRPRTELEIFVERMVPLKAISRRMLRSHTFGYVTAALPGLEAFLTLERFRQLADEAAERKGFSVIDAPASGSSLELLSAPQRLADLAPSGTLNRLVLGVADFLSDPQRFGVLLTVWPQRMAVREALEAVAILRDELRIGYVVAILNGVPDPLFSRSDYGRIQQLAAHRRLATQRKTANEVVANARKAFQQVGVEVFEMPMLYTAEFVRPQIELLSCELARLIPEGLKLNAIDQVRRT